MKFTLHYRGILKANGKPDHKQCIRRCFHKQLAILWQQVPLNEQQYLLEKEPAKGKISVIQTVNGFDFAPLINEQLNLIAELKIIMLRPEPPGSIITQAGDIDNRLKTLFDALKVPNASDIPACDIPREDETPFYCLLEDDNLITKISVQTDRLLYPCENQSEVEMLIHVSTKATRISWNNMGF